MSFDEIEKLSNKASETKIDPTNIDHNIDPENPEALKKQEIKEDAQNERFDVAEDVVERIAGCTQEETPKTGLRLTSNSLNIGVGPWKLVPEAVHGKTMAGEKLSSKDRIMYLLMSAVNVTGYGLGVTGVITGDKKMVVAGTLSYATYQIWFWKKFGPKVIKDLIELAKKAKIRQRQQLIIFLRTVEQILEETDDVEFQRLVGGMVARLETVKILENEQIKKNDKQ